MQFSAAVVYLGNGGEMGWHIVGGMSCDEASKQ